MAVSEVTKPAQHSSDRLHVQTTSYPTGSLDFLVTINRSRATTECQTGFPLRIVIIGAGLGGLAAAVALARSGHILTVFEQAPALGEVIRDYSLYW